MKKLFILVCLVFLISCTQNFQKRVIYYYAGKQTVCTSGGYAADMIHVSINFNGTYIRKFEDANGLTGCHQDQYLPQRIIRAEKAWSLLTKEIQLWFVQQLIVQRWQSKIYKMIQVSTLDPDYPVVTYQNLDYNCRIIGDGTEQHFGTIFPEYPPASVYLRCDIASQQENLVKQ